MRSSFLMWGGFHGKSIRQGLGANCFSEFLWQKGPSYANACQQVQRGLMAVSNKISESAFARVGTCGWHLCHSWELLRLCGDQMNKLH